MLMFLNFQFELFYNKSFNGRKLAWLHSFATGLYFNFIKNQDTIILWLYFHYFCIVKLFKFGHKDIKNECSKS